MRLGLPANRETVLTVRVKCIFLLEEVKRAVLEFYRGGGGGLMRKLLQSSILLLLGVVCPSPVHDKRHTSNGMRTRLLPRGPEPVF